MESIKGREFVFNYVHLLYFTCHNINLNPGGSCINSPDWIKNKKATINIINKKDNECFQYAVIVTSNDEKIKKRSAKNHKN